MFYNRAMVKEYGLNYSFVSLIGGGKLRDAGSTRHSAARS